MPPHSKTVRGTLDNPKTSEAKSNPPQLGDHVSLEREKDDSAPPTPSSPESNNQDKSKLPHSKAVRGTLANASGPKVNKSMLGDPVSLKAETSESEIDRPSSEDVELKKAAEERSKAQSKL